MADFKNRNSNPINRNTLILKVLILVFMALTVFYFLKYNRIAKHHSGLKSYPLVDPARNYINQEDFIVNIQPLREQLNKKIQDENLQDKVSIYFEVLNTGANISVNQQKKIFPASLTKLPLAIATVKKIEQAVWSWDTIVVLEQNDLDQNSGYLYERGIGAKITVEELLRELLINSDNTAYRALLRNVESEYLVGMVSSLGLEDLFQDDGKMSAKEYTRFFRSLYTSSYLKRENSQKILEWMTQSNFNDYIKSGLPNSVKFAHKIGENYAFNSYSDAGIVYLENRPYYLGIMFETQNEEKDRSEVVKFMSEVSEMVHMYMNNQ